MDILKKYTFFHTIDNRPFLHLLFKNNKCENVYCSRTIGVKISIILEQ